MISVVQRENTTFGWADFGAASTFDVVLRLCALGMNHLEEFTLSPQSRATGLGALHS